jgi:hypothetical protein
VRYMIQSRITWGREVFSITDLENDKHLLARCDTLDDARTIIRALEAFIR